MDDYLRNAAELAKAGRRDEARQIVYNVIKQDGRNVNAWILMARLVDDEQIAVDCLTKVIQLGNDKQRAWAEEELRQKGHAPSIIKPATQTSPKSSKTKKVLLTTS